MPVTARVTFCARGQLARTTRSAAGRSPQPVGAGSRRIIRVQPFKTDQLTVARPARPSKLDVSSASLGVGGTGELNDQTRAKSTTNSPGKTSEPKKAKSTQEVDGGELVWVFERRGDGWGEEIFPSIQVQRRPVRASTRGAHTPNSAESLLERLGFDADEAVKLVSVAAAWRVTKRGRALVDRKIMRLVQHNAMASVSELLKLGAAESDVSTILRAVPQILAVPPDNDWNVKYLEYVVRMHAVGGGAKGPLQTKPSSGRPRKRTTSTPPDPLKSWVGEQRQARRCGMIPQDRLYLLDVAGFDKNIVEKDIKKTWEMWFDELVEYKCVVGDCNVPVERGAAGLGAWLERQREKWKSGELSEKAENRLRTLGVIFEEGIFADSYSREMLKVLQGYLTDHGLDAEPPLGTPLAVWLAQQRSQHAAGLLPIEAVDALQSVGAELEDIPQAWLGSLQKADYRQRHHSELRDEVALSAWIDQQRVHYAQGKLSEAMVRRLRHVGILPKHFGHGLTQKVTINAKELNEANAQVNGLEYVPVVSDR